MAESTVASDAQKGPQVLGKGDGLLDKFVQAVAGMIPALESIKHTIEESSGKMPKASDQLTNVTQATESATVEILNVLDSMSQDVADAETGVKELETLLKDAEETVVGVVSSIAHSLASTREKSMSIAMALQVQDITSQQIAGVSHMIESVRLELMRILEHFGESAAVSTIGRSLASQNFDTDAQFTSSPERQEQADLIIQQWTKKNDE